MDPRALEDEAASAIAAASSTDELEAVRVRFLGRNAELPQAQGLRRKLESGWIELLRSAVGLPREQLPLLWDCDFLLGEAAPGEEERHVLCEINVSSVAPYPPSAVPVIVGAVQERLRVGV